MLRKLHEWVEMSVKPTGNTLNLQLIETYIENISFTSIEEKIA
jgi:hypothetical protein